MLRTKLATKSSRKDDDDRLVDRVADTLRAAAGVHALVGGDDRGDHAEDERLQQADPQVGQLGQGGEAREVRARGAVLEDHVEDVAAGDADDADHAVEEERDEHAGEHARDDEALDRVDAQHHHRVELLADLAGAEVGGDGGAAGAGDEQGGADRAACWTTASTDAEPVKDCAPNCLISPPTCSAITAPNGMATSAVGTIVTEAMNHACWMNSRSWNGRRKSARSTSRANAKRLPATATGARARVGRRWTRRLRPPAPGRRCWTRRSRAAG